ncbi:UNVERIFIED_CONTAM: hypothetical protein BJ099_108174 [Lysinibacillus xylanilyticus]
MYILELNNPKAFPAPELWNFRLESGFTIYSYNQVL